jgi:hypothetical protein
MTSRWSVWFCDECKERVRRLHEEFNVYLIPIGRHSVMGGFGLRGKDASDPAKIEALVQVTRNLFARITLLEEWARQAVQRNIEAIGGLNKAEMQLTCYLTRANEVGTTKLDAFAGLIGFFGIER